MKIEREILMSLSAWRLKEDRKPLILQGPRQIGKTWAMKVFGERFSILGCCVSWQNYHLK